MTIIFDYSFSVVFLLEYCL